MTEQTSSGEVLLSIKSVSKTYTAMDFMTLMRCRAPKRFTALREVSFDLKEGEITALLGPNGAGKTTLATIIADLNRANTGSVTVAGIPVPEQSREAQRQIGYLTTNDRSFFWRLSGRKNLEFFATLHGFCDSEARRRSAEMLEQFNLTSQADQLFNTYSTGMKKRLGLARAFLHDPKVLVLDEATNGLDAKATEELLELVKNHIKRNGKTVLWATHRVEEVERLCDRVIVLIGGQVRFDGSADLFLETCRRHMRFTVEVLLSADRRDRFLETIRFLELTIGAEKTDGKIGLSGVGDEHRLSSVLLAILNSGVLIYRVDRVPEPLHNLFDHFEDLGKTAVEQDRPSGASRRPSAIP